MAGVLRGWLARRLGGGGAAHLELGRRGEREAARVMRRAGCRVVARNLRTPGGEADLVCIDRAGGAVVLVEVKTRVQPADGSGVSPTAAIDASKRRRLVSTARSLARLPRFAGRAVRIDVVTVEFVGGERRVRHYVNAVGGDGLLR
ncbi:MAG: YraN family protein [Phycisphaerales bacterium]|nr:YraN family protein [Phycisphaerales bacterium]